MNRSQWLKFFGRIERMVGLKENDHNQRMWTCNHKIDDPGSFTTKAIDALDLQDKKAYILNRIQETGAACDCEVILVSKRKILAGYESGASMQSIRDFIDKKQRNTACVACVVMKAIAGSLGKDSQRIDFTDDGYVTITFGRWKEIRHKLVPSEIREIQDWLENMA